MERPPESTWTWVQECIGECEVVSQYAHDHGYSKLWRIRKGSEHLWLKMHTYPAKWAGEVHALTRWTPSLGLAPAVLAYRADPPAVILTEVPGRAAEDDPLTGPEEERMWSQAGDWLRSLHQIEGEWFGAINPDGTPSGGTSNDPVAFVRATFERRLVEGTEMRLFNRSELEYVEFGVRDWLPSLAASVLGRSTATSRPETGW